MENSSPELQFTYDLSQNTVFKKDAINFINELSINQLNSLENLSILDIYLSKANVIEPHYHQNAAELIYCICGAMVVSIINPFTKELLNFPICPGQVVNVPQGWWHYEVATIDNTHLLAIFDAPVPDTIYGSDLLRLTPPNVLAYTYCLDEAKVKDTLSPIKQTTVLGPPPGCCEQGSLQGKTPNTYPYTQPSQQGYGTQSYVPQQYTSQGYQNQGYTQQYMQQPYVQQTLYSQYPGTRE
ncbi:oxalate decarboxylase/phosphoglucose isomerase-like protein (cupin superfamily) [Paenibacillus wynnii]|nr:oxalate decarboxylase/phosphoglucose isomerase-like protein (cupin superfamily) [Paenibacillus wynnii]